MDNNKGEEELRDEIVQDTINKLTSVAGPILSPSQINNLKNSLALTVSKYEVRPDQSKQQLYDIQQENANTLRDFMEAKRIEGRSETTLYNYGKELAKMFLSLNKSYRDITSADVRDYLAWRKDSSHLVSSSIANMRMYLMSFFKWLQKEELITKNPMDKIGVIKTEKHVIQVLSDEEQEIIRCSCRTERDRAIIEVLSGTGMRVSELLGLNRTDVNFDTREVKVMGKGAKERICFLTGAAKVHLKWYLESRTDSNPALFVLLREPFTRMTKSGVEYLLKDIARTSKMPAVKLYPHKYRSTLATNMINKGCPVDMVQGILGHSNINTTLKCYVKVDKDAYKRAHDQYT